MSAVFDPLRLGAVTMDVMAASHATPAAIAARQQVRLARVLAAARRGSRLYRERLPAQAAGATDLATLPVVTRDELMQRFDDWVTDPALRLAPLREFTADAERIGEPYLGRYMVWESSGTGGAPGIFVQDAQTMAVYDALEALRRSPPRPLMRWLDPMYLNERVAFVGATGGHFASYVALHRLQQLNPTMARVARCFSILQPTGSLVAALNAFAPTILATYPTAAALLADEAARGALQVPLREVWTGGETLGPTVRGHIAQALGSAVRNSYGSSEFLCMGWECAEGAMHLNADWLLLEPVDAQHRPVPAGEPSSTVLLTHLANTVQPLIRYDLGDQLTVHPEPCACGCPLPVIEVQGRRDDPLVMAGPRGEPVTLLPLALTTVLEEEAGVFDFQLYRQDAQTLVLHLPTEDADAQACAARCCEVLQGFAAAQGLAPIRVKAALGQPLVQGRSGKVRRVIAGNGVSE